MKCAENYSEKNNYLFLMSSVFRERVKGNEEVGKEVLAALRQLAQQPEVDKVKLFIDEVDKITSLLLGLSSRLVRTGVHTVYRDTEAEQVRCYINGTQFI